MVLHSQDWHSEKDQYPITLRDVWKGCSHMLCEDSEVWQCFEKQ